MNILCVTSVKTQYKSYTDAEANRNSVDHENGSIIYAECPSCGGRFGIDVDTQELDDTELEEYDILSELGIN
jgi:hypothetical protein